MVNWKVLKLWQFQMGYAKQGQNTAGIHIRQYARAYVFEDTQGYRNAFVSVDAGMMGQLVKMKVISYQRK